MYQSSTEYDNTKWFSGEYWGYWKVTKNGDVVVDFYRLFLYVLSPVTIAIFLVSIGIYLGLFFGIESGWPALAFAIAFQLYAYLVIFFMIWSILHEYLQPNLHNSWIPFLELVFFYLSLVIHNTMIYGGISVVDKDTFIGIEDDFPKWVVLKNTFFLATETTAALGTGSIFANPLDFEGVGFIPVWINSMETILLLGVSVLIIYSFSF